MIMEAAAAPNAWPGRADGKTHRLRSGWETAAAARSGQLSGRKNNSQIGEEFVGHGQTGIAFLPDLNITAEARLLSSDHVSIECRYFSAELSEPRADTLIIRCVSS